MHYVVGDIHGCYQDMMNLFHKIECQDAEAEFILVGDLLDRGPEVDQMMYWSLENIVPDGKYQSILGNHEDMILNWYSKWLEWYENGREGDMPETKYDFSKWAADMDILEPAKLEPLMRLFRQLPLYKEITVELARREVEQIAESDREKNGRKEVEDGGCCQVSKEEAGRGNSENGNRQKYLIVHGFIYPENMKSIRAGENPENYRQTFIWDRGHCKQEYEEEGIILLHGHTPTILKMYVDARGKDFVPGMPDRRTHTINLDTGHVYRLHGYPEAGELSAFCLETQEFIHGCDL